MRITMLVTTTYRNDSRVRRAAELLASDGHDVTVICTYSQAVPDRHEVANHVRVHRVAREPRDVPSAVRSRLRRPGRTTSNQGVVDRPVAGGARFRRLVVPLLAVYRVWLSLRILVAALQQRTDVVHSHDADTLLLGMLATRLPGRAWVHDAHELSAEQAGHFGWERRRDDRRHRRYLGRADAVITVSDSIARELSTRYGCPDVAVVRNIPPAAVSEPSSRDLREDAGVPPGATIILHLGLMSSGRGLPSLVHSVAHLPADVHIVLVGGSIRGHREELKAIAARVDGSRIHILDPVPSTDVVAYAGTADIGVTLLEDGPLNHRYALPNKLFEYVAAGLPVVGSDLPELAGVIIGQGLGQVCDPSDPASIASAIKATIAELTVHRQNVLVAARELTWEREGLRLLEVYASLHREQPA